MSARRLPSSTRPLTARAVDMPALCSYTHHVCMRNRLEGSEFCSRHIPEDKLSLYQQCVYTYSKTGRRCTEVVQRVDRRDGYCNEHALKMMLTHKRNSVKKPQRLETPQSILSEIECHLGASSKPCGNKMADSSRAHSSTFDASSGSEDELSSQLMHNPMTCFDDVDSDAESIDSEQESALKHAGVYTAEEVALIFRDKLIRLQSLYIDQFKRLHHRLREKRREYLRAVRSAPPEESLDGNTRDDINSKAIRERLSALKRYHRRFGKEALLMRQQKERRLAVHEGATHKPPQYAVCEHVSDGERCTARVLPLSKFCTNHILDDTQQVLFTVCGHGDACRQPVAAVSNSSGCQLHIQLDPFQYRYCKREHEDNKEETVDVETVAEVREETIQSA